jgi:FkbM family methyltransferase
MVYWLAPVALLILTCTAYLGGRYLARRELMPYVSEAARELQPLEAKYNGARNSEHGEEWIIRDFFADKRDGVFLDVGAHHYKRYSNTYYLETELGWSGLAIEPQSKFAEEYARYRPRTTFVSLLVSDISNREAILYVPRNDLVTSTSREFAQRGGEVVNEIRTRTTTLDDLLARTGIEGMDFLTMDIELAEPEALAGLSIQQYRPALVCVEAHLPVRQQVLDYFARNGYVVLGKYLRADSHNLWFAPLGSPDRAAR